MAARPVFLPNHDSGFSNGHKKAHADAYDYDGACAGDTGDGIIGEVRVIFRKAIYQTTGLKGLSR